MAPSSSRASRRKRHPKQQRVSPSPSPDTVASSELQEPTQRITRSMARSHRHSDSPNAPTTAMAPQPLVNDQSSAEQDEVPWETQDPYELNGPVVKWEDFQEVYWDETEKEKNRTWARPYEFRSQNDRWEHALFWGQFMTAKGCQLDWINLKIHTAQFSTISLACHRVFADLSSSMQDRFTAFCPRAEEYFANTGDEGVCDIHEALVWRTIWKHQLSPQCQDKWHGPEWAAYGNMRAILQASMTETHSSVNKTFYEWKHHTARMLYVNHGFHSSAERLEKLLREDLGELLYTSGQRREVVDKELKVFTAYVVRYDFRRESTKYLVKLTFEDEETGKIYGFPLPPSDNAGDGSKPYAYAAYLTRDGKETDLIVYPTFRVYGKHAFVGDDRSPRKHTHERDVVDYEFCSFLMSSRVSSGGCHVVKAPEP